MFGQSEAGERSKRYLGLPGNPVSSLVCALVFVVPLIRKYLGLDPITPRSTALLGVNLAKKRSAGGVYAGKLEINNGKYVATPFRSQDSSLLSLMAKAQCLIIRPAHARPSKSGDECEIILL